MRSKALLVVTCAAALALISTGASAKGCIKGAAAGAVAGHLAGHHAVVGAIGGCIVGHHLANKKPATPANGAVTAPAAGAAPVQQVAAPAH